MPSGILGMQYAAWIANFRVTYSSALVLRVAHCYMYMYVAEPPSSQSPD